MNVLEELEVAREAVPASGAFGDLAAAVTYGWPYAAANEAFESDVVVTVAEVVPPLV